MFYYLDLRGLNHVVVNHCFFSVMIEGVEKSGINNNFSDCYKEVVRI